MPSPPDSRRSLSTLRVWGSNGTRIRGHRRSGASLPAPSDRGELPAAHAALLGGIKERIHTERCTACWPPAGRWCCSTATSVARLLRKEREGCFAGTIDHLSHEHREAFSEMRGFSPRYVKNMRAFFAACPERNILERIVAQIS